MNSKHAPSIVALGLLALALAQPAQAAKRGGWDGNGTSVQGTAASETAPAEGLRLRAVQLPDSPRDEWQRRGGWDANGTSVSGRSPDADPQPLRLRAVALPR